MGCVQKILMLSCVAPNIFALFKSYRLLVILIRITYIIFSACKERDTEYKFLFKMRNALYVRVDD